MRWIALVAGAALIVLAFAAASRVADTREGLIAEVITLLAGVTGLSLVTYSFFARKRPDAESRPAETRPGLVHRTGSSRDLWVGIAGVALSIALLAGLGFSGGMLWAGLGFLLLLPMLAGSVLLCWRALRPNP
ncbi:MAG TPA: hypothetical protein VNA65_06965 [Candidatus Dormibacteraeota bacterium]|nr:hypothetical protein [Candidatus Dormibacteraeota bacterium]